MNHARQTRHFFRKKLKNKVENLRLKIIFYDFLWSCLSDSRSKSCNTACCKKSKLVPENVISVTLSVFSLQNNKSKSFFLEI